MVTNGNTSTPIVMSIAALMRHRINLLTEGGVLRSTIIGLAVSTSLLIGGCASQAELIGAGTGAAVGAAIGGGTVATVAGGVVGYQAGKKYDQRRQ